MPIREDNLVLIKSKDFALRIVKFYQYLTSTQNPKRELILSKQVLRSGTSIGANLREARRAQSTADFLAKAYISLKEADETSYWLELLLGGEYISNEMFNSMYNDCEELIKLLTTIIKTTQSKQSSRS